MRCNFRNYSFCLTTKTIPNRCIYALVTVIADLDTGPNVVICRRLLRIDVDVTLAAMAVKRPLKLVISLTERILGQTLREQA